MHRVSAPRRSPCPRRLTSPPRRPSPSPGPPRAAAPRPARRPPCRRAAAPPPRRAFRAQPQSCRRPPRRRPAPPRAAAAPDAASNAPITRREGESRGSGRAQVAQGGQGGSCGSEASAIFFAAFDPGDRSRFWERARGSWRAPHGGSRQGLQGARGTGQVFGVMGLAPGQGSRRFSGWGTSTGPVHV